jgi:copper chaperone CopZ
MKENFLLATLLKFAKIKVVHSTPGRLRLKLPGLRKTQSFIEQSGEGETLLNYKLKGIHSIDFSFLTSKVLILYDTDQTSEKEIIGWLERLREIVIGKISEGVTTIDKQTINDVILKLEKSGYEVEQ